MKKGCIFCNIKKGVAPGRIVYRDQSIIAFFDNHPRSKGHTLVCPIEHHPDIFSIPQIVFEDLTGVTHRLARHYRNVLGATGVNLLNANGRDAQQSVFHFHLHLLPRFPTDGIDAWPKMSEWKGDLNRVLEIAQVAGTHIRCSE